MTSKPAAGAGWMDPWLQPGLRRRVLVRLVAGLSLLIGAMHAGLVETYMGAGAGYGRMFLVAALAQGVYGLFLFVLPERAGWDSADWRPLQRAFFLTGIGLNVAIILLYIAARASGLPVSAPETGRIGPVSVLEIIINAGQLVLVIVLSGLARGLGRDRSEEKAARLSDPTFPMRR